MILDMNPIHDQLKRIADYLELIARKDLGVTYPKVETKTTNAVAQGELFDIPAPIQPEAPQQEAPKTARRGRPPKDSVQVTQTQILDQTLEETAAQVKPKYTEADVREHLMRFVQRNTKDEALALLHKYQAAKIKDLKPIDYDAIISDMKTDEDLHHGKAKK